MNYLTSLCAAGMMVGAMTISPTLLAQTQEETTLLNIGADVRVDWQLDRTAGHTRDNETGFEGKYFNLRLDGIILPGLTYSVRERFSKLMTDPSFWDATDWVYLNYRHKRWNFQAGKEVVAIGGWEYDRNPVDIFAASVFWNNISCYQLGVSAGYDLSPTDRLTAQVTQSPFFTRENRNLYAYNLMWTGSHDCFQPIWTANLVETDKGHYISYIALGNRFDFGHAYLELDFMNRASRHQKFLFADCSVMAEAGWRINGNWTLQGKFTYDVNSSSSARDALVTSGTEMKMAGADIEYYPLKKEKNTLRLHAGLWYSWGKNTNQADLWQHDTLFASIGITWHMNYYIRKKN